jgi:branched-chain amino acid transport system substrate-binding protein
MGPAARLWIRGRRWFFLTVDYAFGRALQQDVTDAVRAKGGEVIGDARHPLNAPDFSSYLLQAQSSKADGIGLANAGADLVNTIKQANEFGIAEKQRLAALKVGRRLPACLEVNHVDADAGKWR